MKNISPKLMAIIIGALAFMHFIIFPAMHRGAAAGTVKSILNEWAKENMLSPMIYWENRNAYPSVPKLSSYKIRRLEIYKKNSTYFANLYIDLKFSDNKMPKNSEWLFALKKTSDGWRVTNFRISRLHPIDRVNVNGVADNASTEEINTSAPSESESGYRSIPALIN
ncbi:MAG: hypothetical protein KBD53_03250 [Candidatus Omnitrophica bacterium]|nr:hypothetical protein [Candidatus Omnitrophota bacterium]